MGQRVCSSSHEGAAYQFFIIVDEDAHVAYANFHSALIVQQLLHMT